MTAPGRLIVIAGTGTEVGKTWVACALAAELRGRGLVVAARKPAQSYASTDAATDADILAAATGESSRQVCPPHRWYPAPMAPFMAADALGKPRIELADLLAELTWPAGIDIGLVETAGGVRSPMSHDGADAVHLIVALRPHRIVLVADAGLGTINAVRLCLAALAPSAVVVMLNRYDPRNDLHERNHRWLTENIDAPVVTGTVALADLVSL